jgi:hypothetical protein
MANTVHTPPRRHLWRIALWGAVALILLTPLVAMQFNTGVAWDAADFALAGGLLIGGALLIELMMWKTRTFATRALIGAAILLAIALIWIEAAVGIFH